MQDIKELADREAERRYGINAFADPVVSSGGIATFRVKLLPNYTLGYLSYHAQQKRFI